MTFADVTRVAVRDDERTLHLAVRDSAPKDDSRPLVLGVHGIPEHSGSWAPVADRLSQAGDAVRLVVFDLPGFGASDKPRELDYSLPALAKWLGLAIDEYLGVDSSFVLAVHDIGGPIGLAWAIAHRDRVDGLLILNTTVFPQYFRPPLPAMVALLPVIGVPLVRRRMDIRSFGAGIQKAAGRRLPRDVIAEFWEPYRDPATRHAAAAVWAGYRRSGRMLHDIRRSLRSLEMASVVLFGAEDPYCTPDSACAFIRNIPGADLELLPGVGHWTTLERPDRVGDRLIALAT